MAKKATKKEVIGAMARRTGVTKSACEDVLNTLPDVVNDLLAEGKDVPLGSVVVFSKFHRDERMGRNPATGEPLKIKAKDGIKAKVMKAFSDSVR